MGQAVHREIGEIELLEALRGIERDTALHIDVVADDLQIGEIGRAVRLGHDVQHQRRGAAGRLVPAQSVEQQLRLGEIGLDAHAAWRSLAEMGNLQRDRRRPMDQMVDLDPELLAHLGIEAGGHLDRRLAVVRGIEDALPGKLGRNPFDVDRAFGFDGLLGHVHVERAAASPRRRRRGWRRWRR